MSQGEGSSRERLLGFDAREMWVDPERSWDPGRRRLYLLREDVDKPLSTDVWVWPSAFGGGLPDSERERLGLQQVELPAWRGPNVGLWEGLDQMRSCLARLASAAERHGLIAVSWHCEAQEEQRVAPYGPYPAQPVPQAREASWALLGFDVADGGFTSALSNCGYTSEESTQWREQWGPRLNEHHLLHNLDQAFAFRRLSEARVPEHAPFFVYGLWRVSQSEGGVGPTT